MQNLELLRFLIYYFTMSRLHNVVIFNCWSRETQISYAQQFSQNHFYIQWFDLTEMDSINSTDIFQILYHRQPQIAILLDISCQRSINILKIANNENFFDTHYHWLIYDSKSEINSFRWLFQNFSLTVDTELTYAMPIGFQNQSHIIQLALFDVYNNGLKLGGKLNITLDRLIICNREFCKVQRYFTDLYLRSKYGNRQTMKDVQLRVATVLTYLPQTTPAKDIINFLQTNNNPEIDAHSVYGFRSINLYREMLKCGFNYTFYNKWSDSEMVGGIIGAVVTDEADLASTGAVLSSKRLTKLSAIVETASFHSVCIFRTPQEFKLNGGTKFLEPFHLNVWLMFLLCLSLFALFLWHCFKIEACRFKKRTFIPSLTSAVLLSFGSACMQGSVLVPHTNSGRIAFFLLFIVCYLIYNYYTSIAVAVLLGSPVKSNIKTIGQLADSRLRVAFQPLPFNTAYLNFSTEPEVVRLRTKKTHIPEHPQGLYLTAETGIRRVLNEPNLAFCTEMSSVFWFVTRLYKPEEICDLNEIPFRRTKTIFLQMNRNSSYKNIIRQKSARIVETGLQQRFKNYWIKSRLECDAKNYFVDVGLAYTFPLFLCLLYGYVAAIIIIIFEINHKRFFK